MADLSLLCNFSFAVFGLDGQLIPDVAEDLADLSFAGPVLDALLEEVVDPCGALCPGACPFLMLQLAPASNLRVFLAIGILVTVLARATI